MLHNVFLKTLRDHRRSVIGWLIGLLFLVGYVIAFWPSIESSGQGFQDLMEQLPEGMRAIYGRVDFSTARGFMSVQLFSFFLPGLFAALAIGRGSRTIAGEEERGDLELLLTRPVPRARVAWQKAAAVLATVAGVVLVLYGFTAAGVLAVGMEVGLDELAGGMLGVAALSCLFGSVAFAVGAATGRRVVALGAGSAFAVVSYLTYTFGPLADLDWLRSVSPWSWAFRGDALAEGPTVYGILGLLILSAVVIAAGVWRFTHRDVGTA